MKKTFKTIIRSTGLRRHHVATARMYCERHWLATISSSWSIRTRTIGRILCYHSVGQAASGVNDVQPEQFRRHIELAVRLGYRFVTAAQIAQTGGTPMDLAITFDDGWTSVLSQAAPILREYQVPWLLFVVSSWSDHQSAWTKEYILPWRDLDRFVADGVEIGSHSATHPDFGLIDRAQMVDELFGSREIIRKRLGISPITFAIPFGQSSNWTCAAGELAREAGYDFVYAQAEDARPSGTIPRSFVSRFDGDRVFRGVLRGAYDRWEEWV